MSHPVTPRFAVGIDLGTTHSAVSAVDLHHSDRDALVQTVLPIPQLVAAGQVESLPLLPSFLYLPGPKDFGASDLTLPWGVSEQVIGQFARQMGAKIPLRLVSSAKSWLCHPAVDRRAPLLPLEAPDEIPKISPLDATIAYLRHLKAAWNHANPENLLENQTVVLTVPASFDPAARELTAEAATLVGLGQLTLLEEPQAAVYSWIAHSQGSWREQVRVGDVILVADVGGGTTDFSLIAVAEQEGNLELRRIAVGDHILLGGDNMDLALAYLLRQKLQADGKQIDAWQTQNLAHNCRLAKEQLLNDPHQNSAQIAVPSRSAKLVGSTLRGELTRDELARTLVDGFFLPCAIDDAPQSRMRSALTKLGLPYAQDAAITRHLAAFLCKQRDAAADLPSFATTAGATFLQPTALLLNGGVFKAQPLATRLLDTLNSWLAAANAPPARVLAGVDLDLAVAKGAAYYGYARQGRGVRIRGGTARAYYVGIESNTLAVPGMEPPLQAVCVAPFGMEEGTAAALPPQTVGVVVGEPVQYRFFSASHRRDDTVGTVLEDWPADELTEIAPIEATLHADQRAAGQIVEVQLRAAVTELGVLQLDAVPVDGSAPWKVELSVRDTPTASA